MNRLFFIVTILFFSSFLSFDSVAQTESHSIDLQKQYFSTFYSNRVVHTCESSNEYDCRITVTMQGAGIARVQLECISTSVSNSFYLLPNNGQFYGTAQQILNQIVAQIENGIEVEIQ